MAAITVKVADGDMPDVIAGLEAVWRSTALSLFFANSDALYALTTPEQRAAALLAAAVSGHARNQRREMVEKQIPAVVDVAIDSVDFVPKAAPGAIGVL